MTGTKTAPEVAKVTHTATVDATQFYAAIANAALFASTDDTLPALTTVHLTGAEPGELRFEATNRYVAIRESLNLIDRDRQPAGARDANLTTSLDIIVPVKGAVKIAKMLKQLEERVPGVTPQPRVVVEYTDGEKHVAFTLTDHHAPDQTLRTEVNDYGEFVKLDALFGSYRKQPKAMPGMEKPKHLSIPDSFHVKSEWLALLAKVTTGNSREDKHLTVNFQIGLENKPLEFRIGERVRGLIMPFRKAV